MGVYKLSTAGGLATPRTNYSSFLAGNAGYVPPSYESIQTTTLSSSQSTISFTSIPATFKHLQIRCIARCTSANSFAQFIEATFTSDKLIIATKNEKLTKSIFDIGVSSFSFANKAIAISSEIKPSVRTM